MKLELLTDQIKQLERELLIKRKETTSLHVKDVIIKNEIEISVKNNNSIKSNNISLIKENSSLLFKNTELGNKIALLNKNLLELEDKCSNTGVNMNNGLVRLCNLQKDIHILEQEKNGLSNHVSKIILEKNNKLIELQDINNNISESILILEEKESLIQDYNKMYDDLISKECVLNKKESRLHLKSIRLNNIRIELLSNNKNNG